MAIWVHVFNVIIFNKFNKKVLQTSLPNGKTFQTNKFVWTLLKENFYSTIPVYLMPILLKKKTEERFKVVNIKLAFTD